MRELDENPIVSAGDPRLSIPIRIGRGEFVTCDDELGEIPRGADIFEMWHLVGGWYLEVPWRHLTFGLPRFTRIRIVKVTG